ncbi:hypothetical protein FQN50_006598 [Emmonsiellopsis sp. PD_5]|nr:hypothetical protein FQN50_006598 [Emmonsiellopsis sp. PD_5]
MALTAVRESSCFNCRSRKVRCDRALPRCSQCDQRNQECLAPEAPPRMIWLPPRIGRLGSHDPEESEVDVYVRRRPLFQGTPRKPPPLTKLWTDWSLTESQQARSAGTLLSLACRTPVKSMLEQLDQQVDGIRGSQTIQNGPFHVFRCGMDAILPIPMSGPQPTEPDALGLWPFLPEISSDEPNDDEIGQISWSPGLYLPEEPVINMEQPHGNNQMTPGRSSAPAELPSPRSVSMFGTSITLPHDLEDFSVSTARLLLDHYQNAMVTRFTPARMQSKSPWEILFVPNILSTLGEILLSGDSTNAKVSLLFAVFAISAFSLDIMFPPGQETKTLDWKALGKRYRERATKRIQMSLRDLSMGPQKKEKYKNVLMPLLSMVTISVVSGEMKNAAHYLRDIEQVIVLHGIPNAKCSRKARMLHSIYLYLVIFTEGAGLPDRNSYMDSEELSDDPNISCDGRHSACDNLLRQPPLAHDVLNLDFMQSLATPRTIFEQIYSIPESLFKLIFRTTQLAREVEILRKNHQRAIYTDHDAFAVRIKRLEDGICAWKHPDHPHGPANPSQPERFPYHLVQAIYAALMIYFYSCVRDVNNLVLQPYVHETVHHLIEYNKQKEQSQDQSADVCWPLFVAGCEAAKPKTRQQICEWLENAAKSTGMRMYSVAREAIQKVWAVRSLPGKQNLSRSSILGEFTDLRVLVLS